MLRVAGAVVLFALAAFFAVRAWNPLGNGYFESYKDSPDGVYLTAAAIGLTLAALFAAGGAAVVSERFRRGGGLLVIAGLAVLASVLPAVLFKWTGDGDTWPWPYFVENGIAWLRFDPRPRWHGAAIQAGLAVVALAAVAAQLRIRRRGAPAGGGPDAASA